MINLAIRLVTLAMFSMALIAAPPVVPAFAAGGGDLLLPPRRRRTPKPPTPPTRARRGQQAVRIDDPAFVQGYRAAYATIYDRTIMPVPSSS